MKKKSLTRNLQAAKKNKNDDFYTQLVDIEQELKNYRKHFKGKVVYCNCDDPRISNFFHYFSYNFEKLGLKKLITTCYKNSQINLFSSEKDANAIKLEYGGDKNNNRVPDIEEIGVTHLSGDGDFRSQECIDILKTADIVVTNPPFSLFREYISQLASYNKKFLIIGNINAITYNETFDLIKKNKLWLGYNSVRHFKQPDGSMYETARTYWYTNLDIPKRYDEIVLYKNFSEDEYPYYDNFEAINVSKTKEIPKDYFGVMGVPPTFLEKFNPNQFELIGNDISIKNGQLNYLIKKGWKGKIDRGYINGKRMYSRLFIKRRS